MNSTDLMTRLADQLGASWPWYFTRGAGLAAFGLMFLLMLSGIGLVTGMTFKFFEPIKAWAIHRALGLSLGAAVLLHIVALLFDEFMKFSIVQVLIPFTASYRPLWVAAGIVGMYLLALVIITSLVMIDRSKRIWRFVHYASYGAFGLTYVHALFTGTDLASGVWRWVWIGLGLVFVVALLARIYRARTLTGS